MSDHPSEPFDLPEPPDPAPENPLDDPLVRPEASAQRTGEIPDTPPTTRGAPYSPSLGVPAPNSPSGRSEQSGEPDLLPSAGEPTHAPIFLRSIPFFIDDSSFESPFGAPPPPRRTGIFASANRTVSPDDDFDDDDPDNTDDDDEDDIDFLPSPFRRPSVFVTPSSPPPSPFRRLGSPLPSFGSPRSVPPGVPASEPSPSPPVADAQAVDEMIAHLRGSLEVHNAAVICHALMGLGSARLTEHLPLIATFAGAAHEQQVRLAALKAVESIGGEAAVDLVMTLLGDADLVIRWAAQEALERLLTHSAQQSLPHDSDQRTAEPRQYLQTDDDSQLFALLD